MDTLEKKAVWPGWETVRLIGRGSYGTVYEIRRTVYGAVERAALKLVTVPQNDSDLKALRDSGYDEESIIESYREYLESIVSEYSLMRQMSGSAHIVNCEDIRAFPHEDGVGWDILIKMELLTPLGDAIGGRAPEELALQVGIDMSKALVLCKKHNIIHRDIKPANIFVSDHGDYKLGDFGIAKTVEKTSGGTKIGTYNFMAPEVYHDEPYGQGADIYSLGLVLYWLLNERRLPFLPLPPERVRVEMEETARRRRLSGEALPPPAHGSEALKRVVLRACAFDPRQRYRTAEELLEALEGLERRDKKSETSGTDSKESGWVRPALILLLLAALLAVGGIRLWPALSGRGSLPAPTPTPDPVTSTVIEMRPTPTPTPSPTPKPRPENVKVFFFEDEKEEFTQAVGEAVKLKAVAYPVDQFADAKFKWSVNDESVVKLTVSDDTKECEVLCLKHQPGGVTLIVECNGVARQVKVYTKN